MPAGRPRLSGARLSGAIMVQGTTSGAGKSTLVAGLCRLLHREGVNVAPFKPQNMANNSAVTIDGGEIGRAQALQAQAAGVAPHSDMNPVLLKPESDTRAQVVIQGRAHAAMDAREYHAFKPKAFAAVMQSWHRLRERHDVVVVEGAGSPAEINLRENDIANMGFAMAADCPVVLVADIDRGGVFAHLLGTLDCLSPGERERVKGFVINRFRGDPDLLQPGIDWLVARTGKPVFGVLPMVDGLHLDAEDAIDTRQAGQQPGAQRLRIVVPVLPRISNHTDFDALRAHPEVDLAFVGPGSPVPPCDVIVLPGSKAVAADLDWLRREGWEAAILRHLRYGGKLIGICGGMQMLGRAIDDPLGLEGDRKRVPGLGLLDFETTLEAQKRLERVSGKLLGAEVSGYEIHLGVTRGPALARPALQIDGRPEGALSADGQILATYVHGLFDAPGSCAALLAWAGVKDARGIDLDALRERSLERLADTLAAHLDLDALLARTLQYRDGAVPLSLES